MNNQIRQSIWSVADVVRKALHLPTPMCLDDLFNAIDSLGGECISVEDNDSLDFEARITAINSSDIIYIIIINICFCVINIPLDWNLVLSCKIKCDKG